MPQIIVTADRGADRGEGTVMLRERISSSDFESATFAARLVERLGWAVDDAHVVERDKLADDPDRVDAHDADAHTPEDADTHTPEDAREAAPASA